MSESKASLAETTAQESAFESCAADVRRYDPDRYFASLFASDQDIRLGLWTLYAFHLEVAKIREIVSEPMLGQIRLQWWRDSIDEIFTGEARIHAVVQCLVRLTDRYDLQQSHFETILSARDFDLSDEPPESVSALVHYAENVSGSLFRLCAGLSHQNDQKAGAWAHQIGTCWALVGLMRSAPHSIAHGKSYIPGWSAQKIDAASPWERCDVAIADVLNRAEMILKEISGTPKGMPWLSALLPLIRRDIQAIREVLGTDRSLPRDRTVSRQMRMVLSRLTGR